jgi:hypothetical protein
LEDLHSIADKPAKFKDPITGKSKPRVFEVGDSRDISKEVEAERRKKR